jgi:predicted MFS family arabinose efflux permease
VTRNTGGAVKTSREPLFTRAFIMLTAAELAYFTALGLMIPATPLFAAGPLGAGEAVVGLVVGAFSITALLLRPWAGRVSDRRGRRPLLLGGALLFSFVSLAHIVATDLAVLTGLRLALGAAEAFFFVAGFAALADLAPPGRAGEALSYNSLALYLGIALGPLLGEVFIDVGGFDLAWLGAAALGLVAAAIAWRLPETWTPPQPSPGQPAPRPAALFHRAAIGPGLALFAGVAAMAGFFAFVALYAQDIGMGGARYVLLAFGLTVVIVRIAFATLPDRVAPLRLGASALALTGIGLLIAGIVPEPIGLFAAAVVMAVGVAFLTPAVFSFLFARISATERGSAMGTASLFLDLAFGGGPMMLGLVAAAAGIPAAFAAGAAIALIGAMGTAAAARQQGRVPVAPQ